jgi:hypothetical protein
LRFPFACLANERRKVVRTPVAVEKGTKAVISLNFSACGKRRFNNLRANFVREIPRKEFFNTHACLRQLPEFPRYTSQKG